MKTKVVIFGLVVFICTVCACASKKAIVPVIKPPKHKIEVIVVPGSTFTKEEINHIIKRTDLFCKQKEKQGVNKIRIEKRNIPSLGQHTRVVYTCY